MAITKAAWKKARRRSSAHPRATPSPLRAAVRRPRGPALRGAHPEGKIAMGKLSQALSWEVLRRRCSADGTKPVGGLGGRRRRIRRVLLLKRRRPHRWPRRRPSRSSSIGVILPAHGSGRCSTRRWAIPLHGADQGGVQGHRQPDGRAMTARGAGLPAEPDGRDLRAFIQDVAGGRRIRRRRARAIRPSANLPGGGGAGWRLVDSGGRHPRRDERDPRAELAGLAQKEGVRAASLRPRPASPGCSNVPGAGAAAGRRSWRS